MNTNSKPQAINLGQPIDDESINRNVIALDSLNPNKRYQFGKSSPLTTDYDIAERELFPDAHFCNSMTAADQHLRSEGLPPMWKDKDIVRFHRHQWMYESWRNYVGGKR